MKEVKIGIIGTGNMGSVHLGFFLDGKIPDARVTAVADLDEAKLKTVRETRKGDYACFKSGDELIEQADVDAVILATPHYSHPPLAVHAFEKGLHVLTEKPAGVYTKQVREMNEAAIRSGKIFGIMFNQRANPLHKEIREAVRSGAVGELKRVNWVITNWYRTQSYYDSGAWRATWAGEGGGVLINQALHQLDLLQWFTGMPKKVRAFCGFGKWHDIEVEDDVSAFFEYENGATGVFVTSTGEPHGVNRLEIAGTDGKLLCERGVLYHTRFQENEREFCKKCPSAFGEPAAETAERARLVGSFDRHTEILNNFVAAIRGDEDLFADGTEGLASVTLLNAMLLSTWQGREVCLPFDEDEYLSELNKRAANSRVKRADSGIILDNRGSFGGI